MFFRLRSRIFIVVSSLVPFELNYFEGGFIQPLKMDLTEGSETSAKLNLTPGKCPKENIHDSEHVENLKSRSLKKNSHQKKCTIAVSTLDFLFESSVLLHRSLKRDAFASRCKTHVWMPDLLLQKAEFLQLPCCKVLATLTSSQFV
jgi:hypothetical protein